MAWQPIDTAPVNELLLILGRYKFAIKPEPIYVLGTFEANAWKFEFPCPPDPPPPAPPLPPGQPIPNPFIPKYWMKLPLPPAAEIPAKNNLLKAEVRRVDFSPAYKTNFPSSNIPGVWGQRPQPVSHTLHAVMNG